MNLLNKLSAEDKFMAKAISVLMGITVLGFGTPAFYGYLDRPSRAISVDVNRDGYEDIVTFNKLKEQEIYFSIPNTDYYFSEKGRAERYGDIVIINSPPFKELKLNLE